MPDTLTVTQFVEVVNAAFDAVGPLIVEGEVAEFKIVHNKWVTFQLKDEESTIPCFMTVWNLRTQLEDGMLVRAAGSPRLRNKGFFSFVVETVVPTGEGALRRAFELLKRKLEQEGLFAPERKRALPRFPQHVALITSPQGAAYSDFLKVLRGRVGGLTVSFIPSQVQGEEAVEQLIRALQLANTEFTDLDAIIMIRGGGSIEDLQAFNDEALVRAVAASRTPTLVGIGHEKDTTLAELAADMRASTPSNAAELLVRSRTELEAQLRRMTTTLATTLHNQLQQANTTITTVMAATAHRLREHVTQMHHRLAVTSRMLESLSPQGTMRRGYSITKRKDGSIVRRATDLKPDDEVQTYVSDGKFRSQVTSIDA